MDEELADGTMGEQMDEVEEELSEEEEEEAAAAEFCHNFFNLFVILESRKKSTVGSTMLGKKWQSIA